MTNHNLKNSKKAPILQWGLGVVAVVLLLVFGISKIGSLSSKKIFTEYPPLYPDTLAIDTATATAMSSDSSLSDNLPVTAEVPLVEGSLQNQDSTPSPIAPQETSDVELFKVNTRYGKIDSPTAIAATSTDETFPETKRDNKDLFEELLLPENAEEDYLEAFQEYAKAPVVSSRSALILLSVLGKQVLMSEQSQDTKHMLQGLAESEGVAEVLIADRQGKVIYASQPQRLHTMIEDWLPELGLQGDRLSWFQKEDQVITAIPVFHRYGKLGVAVMVTQ